MRGLTVSNQLNGVIESDVTAVVAATEDSTDEEEDDTTAQEMADYLPYSCHLLASAAMARGPTVARWVMAASMSLGGRVSYPVMATTGVLLSTLYLHLPARPVTPDR